MPKRNPDNLPFITRDMFDLGRDVAIDLELQVYANTNAAIEINGVTRHGFFRYQYNHAGNYAEENTTFRIPDIPIWVTLHVNDTTVVRGDIFS